MGNNGTVCGAKGPRTGKSGGVRGLAAGADDVAPVPMEVVAVETDCLNRGGITIRLHDIDEPAVELVDTPGAPPPAPPRRRVVPPRGMGNNGNGSGAKRRRFRSASIAPVSGLDSARRCRSKDARTLDATVDTGAHDGPDSMGHRASQNTGFDQQESASGFLRRRPILGSSFKGTDV